jgi:16S rRNA (adenine(1408)-N(1))-methyltransferase
VDLGTGDGRAVIARARREPGALVIGIDASAGAMAESSRRAASRETRGGLANVLFIMASAECPPPELCGKVDLLTILFPWGSLLNGALALDEAASSGIARLLSPRGGVEALVSMAERDGLTLAPPGPDQRPAIAERWAAYDLQLLCLEPATTADIATTGSTWAKRLGAGGERPVWRLVLGRNGPIADRR